MSQFEGPGRTFSFADDVLTSRRGKVRKEIADNAQEELNRIEGWCGDNNGKLHSGKAAALWCSLNNRAVNDIMPKVYIDDNEINRVHVLPYLGLLFDRTLSWSDHTTKTITKARKGLLAMKAVASRGVSQRILLLLYQTLVLSVIEYGFGLMTLADTHLKRLDTIQNEAMRVHSWVHKRHISSCHAVLPRPAHYEGKAQDSPGSGLPACVLRRDKSFAQEDRACGHIPTEE